MILTACLSWKWFGRQVINYSDLNWLKHLKGAPVLSPTPLEYSIPPTVSQDASGCAGSGEDRGGQRIIWVLS